MRSKTELVLTGGLTLVVLTIVALPIFYGGYAIHNDYYVYLYDGCCFPETNFLFLIGRPIGAILLNAEFQFLTGLESLRIARIFGLGLLFLIFLYTYRKFVSIQPQQQFFAWLAALLIAVLPGFLLNTIWVGNHVPGLIGTLVSIWSYYLIDGAAPGDRRRKAQGYAVLFLSFLIYPTSAYYFLVFTVWKALFGGRPIKEIILENIALVFLSIGYLIFAKYLSFPLVVLLSPEEGVRTITTSHYSLNLASSLLSKANELRDIAHITFGLWGADIFPRAWRFTTLTILIGIICNQTYKDTGPSKYVTGGIFVIIVSILSVSVDVHARTFNIAVLLGLCVILWKIANGSTNLKYLASAVAVLAALLIAASPIVASQTGFAVYRNTSTIAAMAALLFVWALSGIARGRAIYVLALCTLMAAGFLGRERLEWTAQNAIAEYNFLKKKIGEYKSEDGVIVIKQPLRGSLIFPYYVYRDFRLLTTNDNNVSGGITTGLLKDKLETDPKRKSAPGLKLYAGALGFVHRWIYPNWLDTDRPEANNIALPVVWAYRDKDGFEMDNRANFIIDMADAGFPPDNTGRLARAVIDVSPTAGSPPIYAFGHDIGQNWSSISGFPVHLSVQFDECRHIRSYEFIPWGNNDFAHLPRTWTAEFRNARSSEITKVHVQGDRPEEFAYPLSKPGCYSSVKFEFIKGYDPIILRIGKIRFNE